MDGGPPTAKSPRNAYEKCKLFAPTSNLQGTVTWEVGAGNLHVTQVARRFFCKIKLEILSKMRKTQEEVKKIQFYSKIRCQCAKNIFTFNQDRITMT